VPWIFANLGLFLLATIGGAVVIGVLYEGRLGVGQGLFAAGFLIPVLFPGWLLHLVLLGLLPPDVPRSRARLVSVVTSPLWLIPAWGIEGEVFVSPLHLVAVAYALVARLRQPKGARTPTSLDADA
jgi:hypothetical protein